MTTVADLRRVDLFDDLDDAQLEPWAEAADPFEIPAGGLLIDQGEVAAAVVFLLEGEAEALLISRGREEPLGRHTAPTWIGAIGALTAGPVAARVRARTTCRGARIPAERFVDLALDHRAVHRRIMRQINPVMTRLSTVEQTRERLVSLGTMAAGLAHELNNPAAAAKRAAAELADALDVISGAIAGFVEAGVSREDAERLVALHRRALASAAEHTALRALDAADAEEAMLEALEDLEVPEPWRLAEPLAAAGLDAAWLAEVVEQAGPASTIMLRWVAASLTAHGLASELHDSAERMGRLVGAIKTYAYVDRGALVQEDVHEGLESTLVMLGHKLKHTHIEVVRDYDRGLPPLTVHGSELNQVWTNLIDNAIGVLGDAGTITVRTLRDGGCAQIEVADDGPGIPEEARAHVLDPFFTTKPVGEGTGLGLDTARRIVEERHTGTLSFETSPAGTTFRVRLPLDGTAS